MGLTTTAFLVLLAVATVALPAGLLFLWGRLRGPRVAQVGMRLGLVLVAQLSAVMLALVAVNDQYLFFTSWQDLLGSPPPPSAIASVGGRQLVGPSGAVSISTPLSRPQPDGGQLLTEFVRGDRSGVTGRVLVHLPPGYATSGRSYPVLEMFQGWHAPLSSWADNMHLFAAEANDQRQGLLGPVITVMPDINVGLPRDLECTDVPGGIQAETWLTTDVRDLVLSQFRALSDAHSWGLMGYSTGGYCAAKFLLRRPGWYHSAVSIAGYFDAIRDNTTGDLWGGSRGRRDLNSPAWLITHRPTPPVELLAFASRRDVDSYPSTARFLALPHGQTQVYSSITPTGGHNYKAVRAVLPELLAWLGARLSGDSSTGGVVQHAQSPARSVRTLVS
jgi:enterochelin esterase-like enzyme